MKLIQFTDKYHRVRELIRLSLLEAASQNNVPLMCNLLRRVRRFEKITQTTW